VGNTVVHLAAAAAMPSPAARVELLRTLLAVGGVDPGARNWRGQTALDMLPRNRTSAAARDLLLRAAAATRCASTGISFTPGSQRFLCSSSGAFFSEGATEAKAVRAFAPRGAAAAADEGDVRDVSRAAAHARAGAPPLVPPTRPPMRGPLPPPPLPAQLAAGLAYGSSGVLLALWPGDERIMRPVRSHTGVRAKNA
jgi:hypothetical protein